MEPKEHPDVDSMQTALERVENLEFSGNDGDTVFLDCGDCVTQTQLEDRLKVLEHHLAHVGLKLMRFAGGSLYDLHANGEGVTIGVVMVDINGPASEADLR